MIKARSEEFQVHMPDGWLVERLPIGAATGRWWVTVVFSGVTIREDQSADPLKDWAELHRGLHGRVRFTGVGAPLDLVDRSASGASDGVVDVGWQFAQNGLTGLVVEYLYEGALLAREEINLLL